MVFDFENVGDDDEELTIEMHHGRFVVSKGSTRSYVGEKVNWFDLVEVDTWYLL